MLVAEAFVVLFFHSYSFFNVFGICLLSRDFSFYTHSSCRQSFTVEMVENFAQKCHKERERFDPRRFMKMFAGNPCLAFSSGFVSIQFAVLRFIYCQHFHLTKDGHQGEADEGQ